MITFLIIFTYLFYVFYIVDVFHWSCLNERQSGLPANTAPGGHTCPTCYDQIFPPSNLISPVADVLRNRLRQSTWGRDELGLVLVRFLFVLFFLVNRLKESENNFNVIFQL